MGIETVPEVTVDVGAPAEDPVEAEFPTEEVQEGSGLPWGWIAFLLGFWFLSRDD